MTLYPGKVTVTKERQDRGHLEEGGASKEDTTAMMSRFKLLARGLVAVGAAKKGKSSTNLGTGHHARGLQAQERCHLTKKGHALGHIDLFKGTKSTVEFHHPP